MSTAVKQTVETVIVTLSIEEAKALRNAFGPAYGGVADLYSTLVDVIGEDDYCPTPLNYSGYNK